MPEENGVVRRIAWREICPWLIIFRSFRISVSLPVLLLATVGWLLTPLGPILGNSLFLGNEAVGSATWLPHIDGIEAIRAPGSNSFSDIDSPVTTVYGHFVAPARRIFDSEAGVRTVAHHVFCFLWNVAVWSFFAVAICRITAVQLGREERVDLIGACRYAMKQYGWSIAAPLFPLVGVVLAAVPISALGLLMRLDFGVLVAGIVWPLAIIGGLIMTILLLGLATGWPLMWPTISSEEHGDAFEAFSRSFSYVFQRPLQYLFYAGVAALFGVVSWLLVSGVSESVMAMTLHAADWGADAQTMRDLDDSGAKGMLWAGASLIEIVNSVVKIIAIAFHFSFFFCVSTAIYLVLRRDVDKSDFDDVFVEDNNDKYRLPALTTHGDDAAATTEDTAASNEASDPPAEERAADSGADS